MLHLRATLAGGSSIGSQNQYSAALNDERDLIQAASKLHGTDQRLKKSERQEAIAGPLSQGEGALLQRIRERLDRSGYQWPAVEVVYSNLSVERKAVSTEDSMPSLFGPITGMFKRSEQNTIKALDGVSGVLKPGSMTLILGPPGSGRSTFMKVLSGRLHSSKMVTIQGGQNILYNGQSCDTFVMQRTAAYVDQVDKLMPTLTCRETLNFAETCAGERTHVEQAVRLMMSWEAANPEKATRTELDDEVDKMLLRMINSNNLMQTEYVLAVLGLQHAGDTLVGDAILRGVSGGEKRRVAVGEAMTATALVLMLDEASTGLDSASTLALTQSMWRWAKLLNTTVVMALLQPEPAVVDLFDDILLLAEGKVLWHGPTNKVLDHFASCGLKPLPGQDLAEFLTQLTSPVDQPALLAVPEPAAAIAADQPQGGGFVSPSQLSKVFWESQQGVEMQAAAEVKMQPSKLQLESLDTRKVAAPWPVLLKACTKRLLKVEFARNWLACAIRWSLALFMAIVTGTLFLQLPVTFTGGVNLLGMLFQALFFMQVLSVPTIEVTFEKRPILFRQRDELFYPAWVEWLPSTLLNVPVLIVDAVLYGTVVYFMIGFTPTAAAYFTFILVMFSFSLLCDNLYRVYGSASKVLSFAIGIGVCHGLINEMLAGFVITPQSIPSYWYWMYWLNPLSYAFRSMAVNEFKQPRWAIPLTAEPGAPSLGDAVLGFFQINSTAAGDPWAWVWGGVGVLIGMAAFCAGLALLAYKYNTLKESPAVLMGQQQEEDERLRRQKQKQAGVTKGAACTKAACAKDACAIELTDLSGADQATGTHQGVSISFQRLCYYVPDPSGGKSELQLLHNITGAFKPGQLTALMGSSGAGKTTLMDVIAGRKTAGRITGTLCVDGHPRDQVAFSRLTGYVEQTDIHVPLATVREALTFSAQLRAPLNAAPSREQLVESVLAILELSPLANRLVGTAGVDGLSSEQRKRLTIAVELVTAPKALFLDEPTSGLDTRAAAVIADVMKQISSRGVTVVATIHQPSQAIFKQFDELLLLKRGGHVVFFGELGPNATNLIQHFSAVPGAPLYQQGANPAAWMLDVVSGPQAILPGYTDLAEYYHASKCSKVAEQQASELCGPSSASRPLSELTPAAPASSIQQFRLLLQRNMRSYWRNPSTNLSRYIVTLAISLIVGSIEFGKGNVAKIHDARGVQNCLGALYMVVSALSTEVGFECQAGLSKERVVYYRERAAGCYGAAVYMFAQAIIEIMYVTVQVTIYTLITYFMVGFSLDPTKFFYVFGLTWLNCCVSFLTSQALVHTTPMIFIATTLFSVLSNLQGLTSGYTRPLPATPPAWWGAYFLNPSFYTFIGIGTKMLGSVTSTIPDPSSQTGATVAVYAYVAKLYRMGDESYPGALGALGMLAVFCCVLLSVSFCGLRFAKFQSR